ncbi:NAD-dependent epimerase/dehydratase family protein [Methanobacterium formicicum]|uniref:NAD-dependent epimerase/dehydratase family protein n=1 Tax=Methanobacterium formicicum TaxID=2162 RepID=UPI00064E3D1D
MVVTGGLGFIGSHIVEELYGDNEVFIVDNEATGKPENIQDFDLNQISLILGDITTIKQVLLRLL